MFHYIAHKSLVTVLFLTSFWEFNAVRWDKCLTFNDNHNLLGSLTLSLRTSGIFKDEAMKCPISLSCLFSLLTISLPLAWTSKQWLLLWNFFAFHFDFFPNWQNSYQFCYFLKLKVVIVPLKFIGAITEAWSYSRAWEKLRCQCSASYSNLVHSIWRAEEAPPRSMWVYKVVVTGR